MHISSISSSIFRFKSLLLAAFFSMSEDKDEEELPTIWTRVCELTTDFAGHTTCHGCSRISDSADARRIIWVVVFTCAVSGCLYHCSSIIMKYMEFAKVTSTEEFHATELDFPALTVCNMNILKKKFLKDQIAKNKNLSLYTRGFCFDSLDDFLNQSQTKDLSDIWGKLGITAEHLEQYGHKVYDLIVQCTYNSKDCFNQSITSKLPLITEHITITNVTSSMLGLCHTILLNETTYGKVKRAGQTRGLTLTLNIERDKYLSLLSPEYGVRLMVHPRHSFPTIERGGIALHPGTKTYVSIKIRLIERLPAPYGDCTNTFSDSPMTPVMKQLDKDFFVHEYYTGEYCLSLCRETLLFANCSCVDEQLNPKHKFCNPCNETQEQCRTEFHTNFTADENNICTVLCKPSCVDIRYDISLSRSEWPNMEFQQYVLRRWPELIPDFVQNFDPNATTSGPVDLNETYINKNFLRVHVFIQEMNYLHFKDVEAYSLPEMFADLGGCLGLYIGVSVISIMEMLELASSISALLYSRLRLFFGRYQEEKLREEALREEAFREQKRRRRYPEVPVIDAHVDPKPFFVTPKFRCSNSRRSNGEFSQWAKDRNKGIHNSYQNGFIDHL